MRKRRLLTDDEIEQSVQHDMAVLREMWAEQGYDPNTGPNDDRHAVLCHEYRRSKRRCAAVLEMKEGPSGSAIRSLIPSHRKLLRSKAVVVSVAETSGR